MEMGLTRNQEHPCCHPPPRAAPWAGVHGGFAPPGGSLCAGPPLKQVGPACHARWRPPWQGARRAGATSPRRPQLSRDRVSSRRLPPGPQEPSRQAKPVMTPGSSAPTLAGS